MLSPAKLSIIKQESARLQENKYPVSSQASVERQQKLASISAASMANRETPLIRNAWYVAARSDEISRALFSRQYLGISTVLFRKEDGTPVALQNRCCHRSFPLSEGKLPRRHPGMWLSRVQVQQRRPLCSDPIS